MPLLQKSCGGQPNNNFFRPYKKVVLLSKLLKMLKWEKFDIN